MLRINGVHTSRCIAGATLSQQSCYDAVHLSKRCQALSEWCKHSFDPTHPLLLYNHEADDQAILACNLCQQTVGLQLQYTQEWLMCNEHVVPTVPIPMLRTTRDRTRSAGGLAHCELASSNSHCCNGLHCGRCGPQYLRQSATWFPAATAHMQDIPDHTKEGGRATIPSVQPTAQLLACKPLHTCWHQP